MSANSPTEITQLLQAWGGRDEAAMERLAPLVYRQLHHMARRCMSHEQNSPYDLRRDGKEMSAVLPVHSAPAGKKEPKW